ncbi:MAG: hypothetical protein ABI947_12980 [Chloroflexota bacterium]
MLDKIDSRPEEGPPAPETSPIEVEDAETEDVLPSTLDPAFLFIILAALALFGLNNLAFEIRYTLLWTLLAVSGVIVLVIDKIALEPLTQRDVLVGLSISALIGLPVLAVGAAQLHRVSLDIFGKTSDAAVFQILAFTMPLAEGLYFRAALQGVRGPIFTGGAAGLWAILMFFPQLDVLNFPLPAAIIGLCLVFVNFLYSYLRHRFGFYTSWICQIGTNLLLLFVVRFI